MSPTDGFAPQHTICAQILPSHAVHLDCCLVIGEALCCSFAMMLGPGWVGGTRGDASLEADFQNRFISVAMSQDKTDQKLVTTFKISAAKSKWDISVMDILKYASGAKNVGIFTTGEDVPFCGCLVTTFVTHMTSVFK